MLLYRKQTNNINTICMRISTICMLWYMSGKAIKILSQKHTINSGYDNASCLGRPLINGFSFAFFLYFFFWLNVSEKNTKVFHCSTVYFISLLLLWLCVQTYINNVYMDGINICVCVCLEIIQ